MRTSILMGAVVTSGFLGANLANAAVLFDENIDNMTLNSTPAGNTTTGNGTWSSTTTGGNVTVIADPTGAGRGQVIEMNDTSASDPIYLIAGLEQNTTSAVLVTYDIYHDNGDNLNTANMQPLFQSSAFQRSSYTFWNNGEFKAYGNGGSAVREISAAILPNTWYRVEMVLPSLVGQNSTVYEPYSLKLTNLATQSVIFNDDDLIFYSATAADYHRLLFQLSNAAGKGKTYHDNILVTTEVPEPAALGLISLGGLLMIGRRHR